MKRRLCTFLAVALLACVALFPQAQSSEVYTPGWLVRAGQRLMANQNLCTTDSPTFAGLTLSGGTASTLAYLNASKAFTSLANSAGYLLNDGSGGLSWGAVSLSGYLKADGTVPLTADWNVGAFDLTCVDMTATNFKLSGVGTLTSALGNVSLTTSLTAVSGDEVGFNLPLTVNKTAGNYTALKVNVTETSAPGTTDLLMDLQVGTSSKFRVMNDGKVYVYDSLYATGNFVYLNNLIAYTGPNINISSSLVHALTSSGGSGTDSAYSLTHTLNQTATAGSISHKINRTETALGSGTHQFASYQVANVEKFGVSNNGAVNSTIINNTDSDTDEIDSVTWAGGYGIVIACSTTDGTSAVWKLKGTTFEAIEVDADWTAVKDNASSYNVYFETGAIKLQNKVGDNKAVKLGYFGI